MQRLSIIALLSFAFASCTGRDHIQSSGDYALSFLDSEIIKDTCGVLRERPLGGDSLRKLWDVNLTVLGDTVRMRTELYNIQLVGDYQRALGEDLREHFIVDGSANKVTADIAGAECLVDIVTLHLEANTEDENRFSGVLSVRYDTRQPASCNCEYLVNFRAVKQEAP